MRVVPNKHAEGESFQEELEKAGRYMIGISMISLKTIGRYDVNRTNEFYFRVYSPGVIRRRVPNKGQIELRENQVFNAKSDTLTLWSQFIRFKQGEEKFVKISIELCEEDPGINQVLGKEEFTISCPQPTKYVMLESKDGRTKAKLKIFAKSTLY